MKDRTNAYQAIIEDLFERGYRQGADEVVFTRRDIPESARRLGLSIPKNLGDVIYSLRYRTPLPDSVTGKAPPGREWAIFPAGRSVYVFRAVPFSVVEPRRGLARVKVPDATPGMIAKYAMSDEQALLAKVRYNRLIDIFTGLACYSLQSHLRTSITVLNPLSGRREKAQVETDELYVGVDRHGAHYAIPVQAKGGTDILSVVQIWQDVNVVAEKLPGLVPRPVAAQFMPDEAIALFEFDRASEYGIGIVKESHYELVSPSDLSDEDLRIYRSVAGEAG